MESTVSTTGNRELIEEGIRIIEGWYVTPGNHAIGAVLAAARGAVVTNGANRG